MTIIRDVVWCAEGVLRCLIGRLMIGASRILDALRFYEMQVSVAKFATRQILKAITIFRSKVLPMDDDLNDELSQKEKELFKAMQTLEDLES